MLDRLSTLFQSLSTVWRKLNANCNDGEADFAKHCTVSLLWTLTQPQKGRKYTLPSALSSSLHPEQEKDDPGSVADSVVTISNNSYVVEYGVHA
jgi:hypothetical protein